MGFKIPQGSVCVFKSQVWPYTILLGFHCRFYLVRKGGSVEENKIAQHKVKPVRKTLCKAVAVEERAENPV